MIKRLFSVKAQKVVQWVIVCWGLAYFGHKIISSGFSFAALACVVAGHAWLMALQVVLLCLNFCAEALKWRSLMMTAGEVITMRESLVTSIKASALGNASLGGLGEHIARVGEGGGRRGRLRLSMLSSVVQNIVIVGAGLIALVASDKWYVAGSAAVVSVVCLVMVFVWFFGFGAKGLPWIGENLSQINGKAMTWVVMWNVVRYLTFAFQLYLFLSWADVPLVALAPSVAVYYLIITLLPTMRLADIGIKGSTALFVFSPLLSEVDINNGVMAIWLLNTIVPTAIGFAIMAVDKTKR